MNTHARIEGSHMEKRKNDDGEKDGQHVGWSRSCLNIRMTMERVAKLRGLAEDIGPAAGPTDALDLGLELAIAARRRDADRDVSLEDAERVLAAVERLSDVGTASSEAHAAALVGLASEVRGLSELISAVAATAVGSGDGFDEPATLRSWLDAQWRANPASPISARACWQSKTREGERRVRLELLMRRTTAPSERRAGAGLASIVKIERLAAESPLARTDLISDFMMECRRAADGSWRVAGFQLSPDGTAGPLVGSISV